MSILLCVDNQRDSQFLINNFYSTDFFLALHVPNESSHSSPGALPSILYHAVGTILQACLAAMKFYDQLDQPARLYQTA